MTRQREFIAAVRALVPASRLTLRDVRFVPLADRLQLEIECPGWPSPWPASDVVHLAWHSGGWSCIYLLIDTDELAADEPIDEIAIGILTRADILREEA